MLFVGIDCGTQSAKVGIYAADGSLVAHGQQALEPMVRPSVGVVQHPSDDLWTAIAAACQLALSRFNGQLDEVGGIGVCVVRCCKAFLNSDGSLVEPVMSWMDDRAYTSYQPDGAARVTTSSGYIIHRLTGEFADSAADSIAMQWPIDAPTWTWSSDSKVLCESGLTHEQLSELHMPGTIVGALTESASKAIGLPAGLPVICTANDKAVEYLSAGPLAPGTVLVSLGTYIAAMTAGSKYLGDSSTFWTNFGCLPNQYLYESNGIRRGMWTLTWLLDLLGPEFATAVSNAGVSREEYLEHEAATVPAGSDGLRTVLDFLAPSSHPFRKGVMLGFDARHSRGHLYRSVMEAIALSMRVHVDAMQSALNTSFDALAITGGGAASPLFMQIFADVFNVPTQRSFGVASLGAAMCAAAATGTYSSIHEAAAAMAPVRVTFTPDPNTASTYRTIGYDVADRIRTTTDQFLAST